jgi:retron-type reverse transcriptase
MQGEFPREWKQAAVTPVLKKGNPQLLNNYRPVSCLPSASKVLEIVVCSQLSDYLETNKLLPDNQHGFRPKRSTMTAWQEIQLDWALNTEQNMVTGVLLWDLSAAFDTLDCEGLCKKLALFGVKPRSVGWVKSFLTGRSQKVRIGSELSSSRMVTTGVPQGGILSPLIFVLFVSDLQDWLSHSTAQTYADDTHTGTSCKRLDETLTKMEEDAKQVLQFMASNGLVANAKKTSFLLLNCKDTDSDVKIKIGSEMVTRESTAKLLGIEFQDNQKWNVQVHGKGGLLSS